MLLSSVLEHLVTGEPPPPLEVLPRSSVCARPPLTSPLRPAARRAAGEVMQMTEKPDDLLDFDHYLQKTHFKTASLLANSARAVAILGGARPEVVQLAYDYGQHLGLAFQLIDDVLARGAGAPSPHPARRAAGRAGLKRARRAWRADAPPPLGARRTSPEAPRRSGSPP